MQPFLICFKEIIFRLKLKVYNDDKSLLCVFKAKVKNLAFDTSKVITNAWFSMKN